LLNKKDKPKALMEGREKRTKVRRIAPSKTTMARAERRMVF